MLCDGYPKQERIEKLNSLSIRLNGGKGSGNPNPGQGRGVGKPAGGSSRTKVFDNPWFAGAYYWEPLSDLETYPGGPTDKEYFRQKGIATKVVEIKPEDYLKMIQKGGHSTEWSEEYLASHEASQKYKEEILKGEPLATPDFELKEDGTISGQEGRHRSSGAALAGVKAIPVMITYHVQADNIDDFLKDFEYKDITDEFSKLVTDYKKKLEEDRYNCLTSLEKTFNGGKNSGNHNPGQGRGVGKPGSGHPSSKTYTYDGQSKEFYKQIVESHRDTLDYFMKNGIVKEKDVDKAIRKIYDFNDGEITIRKNEEDWSDYTKKKVSFDEWKNLTLDSNLDSYGNYTDSKDYYKKKENIETTISIFSSLSDKAKAFFDYEQGAKLAYGTKKDDRKNYDEKYGISEIVEGLNNFDSKTPIYRGVRTTAPQIKELVPGTKIDMNGVSSWSSDESVASDFTANTLMKTGSKKLVFVNEGNDNRKAAAYPASSRRKYENQQEVLVSKNTNFVVQKVEQKGSIYYAYVKAE